MDKRDYYEVLGVSRQAADAEIKKSYRSAAMKFHPDRNPGDKVAEENFKLASEAYEVLSDPQKRQVYDRYGHQGLSGQGFQGFSDVGDVFESFGSIFEDLFGFSGGFGGGGKRARKGANLRFDLELTFEEAVFGVEKEIEFQKEIVCKTCKGSGAKPGSTPKQCRTCGGAGQVRRNQGFFSVATVCPSCRGEGRVVTEPCKGCHGKGVEAEKRKISVKIPAGVDTGLQLRVAGEGEIGANDGPSGDLYVVLHVQESKDFERDGVDLICRRQLGIAQASLGCKLKIKTLEGEKTMEVPAGVQHGQRLTLANAGVPQIRGQGRGDLHVEIQVVIPKKVSKEQRELLEKYAEISGEVHDENSGGFFHRLFGDK